MVKFKEFKVGELFEVVGNKQVKSQKNIVARDDGIPFVVQSTKNNMVKCHVDRERLLAGGETVYEGNAIVLGVVSPVASYQETEFGASQSISLRADFLNPTRGLYLVTVIRKVIESKYSYTNLPGIEKYKQDVIQLPVKPDTDESDYTEADIDWDYMESYIHELEESYIHELDVYLKETGLDDYRLTDAERDVIGRAPVFREFKVGELFDVTQGRRLKKSDFENGNIPFVMASSKNNGVVAYLSNPVNTNTNFITADILGNVFYQDGLVGFGDDNCGLKLKDGNESESVYLYLACAISRFKSIASYGNKLRGKWYNEQFIQLPVKPDTDENNYSDSDIDWEYMESYIRVMEKQVIADVVDYKNAVIENTKKIVSGAGLS
jgi:hypothetical protein